MPVAVVIGQEPAAHLHGGVPTLEPVSELDRAGAIRGGPIDVIKCETSDRYVRPMPRSCWRGTIHRKSVRPKAPDWSTPDITLTSREEAGVPAQGDHL